MKVGKSHYRTIWPKDKNTIQIIDQRSLPHAFIIEDLKSVNHFVRAIQDMHVRGAGLIGAAAGYGIYIATLEAASSNDFDEHLKQSAARLATTRPTAVNLSWALKRQLNAIQQGQTNQEKVDIAWETANEIADEDVRNCKKIGEFGLGLLRKLQKNKGDKRINILTHCNAGWLAFVDYGSATAPIYKAFEEGMNIHVWVDETRPRNQGARLTAWELNEHGVPHTVISDNVGGHLMQHGLVDMVLVGTDRTTYTGDVANKIGTYLKALAAADNKVPFYVTLPSSSFDWQIRDGSKIPIEQRNEHEVKYIQGLGADGINKVLLTPEQSPAANYAFDVTPARLVTGLITERGICKANEKSIRSLFPENEYKDFDI